MSEQNFGNRCNSVFERLDSRCILRTGHNGKHRYPNALWKKENPDEWDTIRISPFPFLEPYSAEWVKFD